MKKSYTKKLLILCLLLTGSQLFAAELFRDGFESATTDWTGRGAASVAVSTTRAHAGSRSLFVSGRTAAWNGATVTKTSLTAGGTYTFEGYVLYDNSSYSSQKFELCLEYKENGTTRYPAIGSVTVSSRQWGKMSGTITIPANVTNIALYVQSAYTENPTAQDLMDFYIDDISCDGEGGSSGIISLKEAYRDYFKIGTAVSSAEISKSAAQELVKFHFNSITPENELKPDATLNQTQSQNVGNNVNPQVQLSNGARTILKWCSDNKIPVRGHTLVWHSQTPDWFFIEKFASTGNYVSVSIMNQRMENYIKNLMELIKKDFPNLEIYAWDVVNEAFRDGSGDLRLPGSNNNADTRGTSLWMQIYGNNTFIYKAFEYARKYAPAGCKLYYNDFNEYLTAKRDAIYNLVSDMYKKGICDGVGMQSHLSTSSPTVQTYTDAVKKFASIGCDIQITELDITIQSGSNASAQAKIYGDLFQVYKQYSANISAVVFWGTQDGMSWRKDYNPLIFDREYQPKEAYYKIVEGMSVISTDIATVDAEENIRVYPAYLTGSLTLCSASGFTYRIFNSMGHLIATGKGYGNKTIDASGWVTGIYYVSVYSEGKKLFNTKVIKL